MKFLSSLDLIWNAWFSDRRSYFDCSYSNDCFFPDGVSYE